MRLEPYLFFDGRTEEALKFSSKAIGAETLSVLYFKDSPEGVNATPEWQDKVMHATFRRGPSVIMASDGVDAAPQVFSGFSDFNRRRRRRIRPEDVRCLEHWRRRADGLATNLLDERFRHGLRQLRNAVDGDRHGRAGDMTQRSAVATQAARKA
jgi:hypothetical protein